MHSAEEDADVLVWHRQDFALDAQSLDAASLGLDSASHGGSDRFSVSASQGFGQNTAQTRKDSDQYNVKAIVQRPRVCLELHLPGMSSITRCGDGAHPGSAALMNAHMMTPERQNELAYVFNHTLYTKNMVVPDPGRLKVVMKGECALVYYYREGILPGTKPGQQGNAVSRAIKKRQHSRVVVARLAEGMVRFGFNIFSQLPRLARARENADAMTTDNHSSCTRDRRCSARRARTSTSTAWPLLKSRWRAQPWR